MRHGLVAVILAAASLNLAPAQAAQPKALGFVSTQSLPSLGPAGDGRRKFVQFQCYLCHGNNGAGQFGPNIQGAGAGDVSDAVRQGVPEAGMPSYGPYASGADITNIAAYLSSVGTKGEPKFWNWWQPHPVQ